ncbi:MAG: ethanolamine ammonia lyase large subunit [Candidatus Entotheonella gemina]|uniref:Ethanolamine ammonia lyase large subunit n=1 Tax=Candidatus Entotheonella gemina TaxID=1429439 RepID=W4LKN4_9BACT|nr:MAG: ethanolamine ammonia lyase large subunit [Candidatus Entotheonella gemina]
MDMARFVTIPEIELGEDIFAYMQRTVGHFDATRYRQLVGAANDYKEGDEAIGVAAADTHSRECARTLLSHTTIAALHTHPLFIDDLQQLIWGTTAPGAYEQVKSWKLGELKAHLLEQSEADIKAIMPGLNSDVIAAVTKLMSNDELVAIGQKVFNPLPDSQLGAKGYMGARIQPNSPTDNPEDIAWQVFNGFAFATGDVLVGTNPVDSSEANIAAIEQTLKDIIETFDLAGVIPWSVLAHIDIQAAVAAQQPGLVALTFQSLAGTDDANRTFDLTLDKMLRHARSQTGKYGLYFETGQGADFTNGAAHGFDMVVHESRKYGFARALKQELDKVQPRGAWVHVNDVAGFIGPEVFKTREQLVRAALEDTVMGKLHGLFVGLDVCSTLHMPISLDDLDWALDQIMPANPGYLMALPSKNDPMLSYLTTSFQDHVRLRHAFDYKVNDAMWAFYQRIGIIDDHHQFTEHAGDPVWVYYQYRLAKGDTRSRDAIEAEGREKMQDVQARGVPLAIGHGERVWEMDPELTARIARLYEDAKVSLWAALTPEFVGTIPNAVSIATQSQDRADYIAHPASGETLSASALAALETLRNTWGGDIPDVQIVISDGLNAKAIMDEGHLAPYVETLREELHAAGLTAGQQHLVMTHGRVRAGYAIGDILFAQAPPSTPKAIIHVIGERPGTGHHNFSVYLAAPKAHVWAAKQVDHDIVRVLSGISDTAMPPAAAAEMTVHLLKGHWEELR